MTVLARSLVKAATRQFSTTIARRSGHGVEPPGSVRLRLKMAVENGVISTLKTVSLFRTCRSKSRTGIASP